MDKSIKHPFGEEIGEILRQRFTLRADKTLEMLAESDVTISKKELPKLLKYILDKIFSEFCDETERYKKKSRNKKNGYLADIAKAKKGNNRCLFRLIAWDKSWLFFGWVKNVILHAQEDQNSRLLQELGEALAHEPGVNIPIAAKDKQERKEILDNIKCLTAYYVTKNPDIGKSKMINKVIKGFHGVLREQWDHWQNDESDIVMVPEYFKQYLKRQKAI